MKTYNQPETIVQTLLAGIRLMDGVIQPSGGENGDGNPTHTPGGGFAAPRHSL